MKVEGDGRSVPRHNSYRNASPSSPPSSLGTLYAPTTSVHQFSHPMVQTDSYVRTGRTGHTIQQTQSGDVLYGARNGSENPKKGKDKRMKMIFLPLFFIFFLSLKFFSLFLVLFCFCLVFGSVLFPLF
jgi:hypothetical protein